MSFLTTFLVIYFLCVLYVKTQNNEAKLECEQFDDNESSCNSHTFTIVGYGNAGCTYVPLTSLDSENPEYVCLPDHCGLFASDETRCQDDVYCSWERDPNNLRSTEYRCYPVCFNKLDIMFLVDGSNSRTEAENEGDDTPFELNLEAIQSFVENNIPEYGTTNEIYETREYILSFAGRDDSAAFEFDSTLSFTLSESLEQSEIYEHILDLEGVGINTNLRRALLESYFLFQEDTKPDHQRVLMVFSDGAPTEETYVSDHFDGDLDYDDHSDAVAESLGLIGCQGARCTPYQYYDLATLLWDKLNVYYLWVLLGEEIQTFPSGVSNGPQFAADFTVDDTSDLIEITDDDFSPFLNTITASSLSRTIDASVCSRLTTAPTSVTSSPTISPTVFSPPGLGDSDISTDTISDTDSPTSVPTTSTTSPTMQPTMNPIASSAIFRALQNDCLDQCSTLCGKGPPRQGCRSCCNGLVNDDTLNAQYSTCITMAGSC